MLRICDSLPKSGLSPWSRGLGAVTTGSPQLDVQSGDPKGLNINRTYVINNYQRLSYTANKYPNKLYLDYKKPDAKN